MADEAITLKRLNEQIEWYDGKSLQNQRLFKWLKFIEIASAALIPFAAGYPFPPLWTGLLGVIVVVLEGLQHINQFQHNWILFRSTCEDLKHEKFLYLASSGPYDAVTNPSGLLAERVEELVSREHAKWVSEKNSSNSVSKKEHNSFD